MFFADLGEPWGRIAAFVIVLAFLASSVFFLVKGHRWFGSIANRAIMRSFEGAAASPTPGPGLVHVIFHTYYGILVFTHQVEHEFWATPDDARLVFSRLNRFNLKWGFFAYGAVIIPILSLGNYWVQLARIRKQCARTPHD
jgi:hypothetical protein